MWVVFLLSFSFVRIAMLVKSFKISFINVIVQYIV